MSMDEALQIFVTEGLELLEDMEAALLELERSPNDADLINRIFRAAHTIKGSSGLFGLDHIVEFTHVLENLLDDVRRCLVPVTPDLITVLMQAKDHVTALINGLLKGSQPAPDQALVELLDAFRSGGAVTPTAVAPVLQATSPDAAPDNYHISLRLGPDSFRDGLDPISLFRTLSELGTITEAVAVTEGIPVLSELDAENCHLGWEIALHSGASKQEIAEVFEFMEGASIYILPPESTIDAYRDLIQRLPEDEAALGEILVQVGSLTPSELHQALNQQHESGGLTGQILVEQRAVQPAVVDEAVKKQEQVRSNKQRELNFVRVDAAKLDVLVNLVGELVTSGAKLTEIARSLRDDHLSESVTEMTTTLEEMRESALGLRMVPVGGTFNRFQRVVRDIAKELGKDIRLDIFGSDTELDKTMIDQIADPLTHLVRNAMDHGIEAPAARAAAGKPAQGVITLNAYHESGAIVIEISDDGRGMDPERIYATAVARGLVKPNQSLPEREIYQLIFEPGFSTAEQVSNISGRGVGMDVVRRNIDALRGRIDIDTLKGRGTRIKIYLPLTLAIIDGFHIQVAGEPIIIPLDMVMECVTMNPEQWQEATQNDYINLRNEVLPLIHLRSHLGIGEEEHTSNWQNVVVVRFSGKKAGLVVDSLLGEIQAVIKPLGRVFKGLEGFAGFTILGSGHVALILDVPGLLHGATVREQTQCRSPSRNGPAGRETPRQLH